MERDGNRLESPILSQRLGEIAGRSVARFGFPRQVSAPPRKPKDIDNAPLTERYGWREMRRRQSSTRICVEHANAEHRQWRPLQRYTGRREEYGETHLAIAGLVSDRAAERATRHRPGAELVLVRTTAC